MATSPNFSWPEPDNTDLVKNGALAIRTAVDAIDSSLVDLKGGTTGQVLSKTSNTDMDFTWVAQDDSNAIQNAIVDAKGDLIAASAADTPARLAAAANLSILQTLSSETTGLKWITPDWISWTPTVTSQSGTFTTVSAVGTYYQIGKTVFFNAIVTITNAGTAAGFIRVTLPSTPNSAYTGIAQNTNITGKSGAGQIATSDAAVYCSDSTNATLIATGAVINVTGMYRVA